VTPHRFSPVPRQPVLLADLQNEVRESPPRYWVVVATLLEGDAEVPPEMQTAAYDFDTEAVAADFAYEQLHAGSAVFFFWGWRTPVIEMARTGSLLGSGAPLQVLESISGQLGGVGEPSADPPTDADSEDADDEDDTDN